MSKRQKIIDSGGDPGKGEYASADADASTAVRQLPRRLETMSEVTLRMALDMAGVSNDAAMECVCRALRVAVTKAQSFRKVIRNTDDPKRSLLLAGRAFTSLTSLDLSDCDWTDADARELRQAKHSFPKLKHLNLSGAIKVKQHSNGTRTHRTTTTTTITRYQATGSRSLPAVATPLSWYPLCVTRRPSTACART